MKNNSQYSFEAIFDIDEARSLFKDFLIREKNVEPFLFVEQAELYSLKKSDYARFEFAHKIIKDFIAAGCEHEINVSGEMKDKTLKAYKSCDDSECPLTLFQEVQAQIMLELKIDCFPRFVKTQQFEQFVSQKKAKDENFLQRIQKKRRSAGNESGLSFDQLRKNSSSNQILLSSSNDSNTGFLGSTTQSSSGQKHSSLPNNNADIASPDHELAELVTSIETADTETPNSRPVLSQQTAQFLKAYLPSKEELPPMDNTPTPQDPSISHFPSPLIGNLDSNIIHAMSKPYTGIGLRDRKLGLFKTYSNCFSGTEMINWVQTNYKMPRDDVIKFCNRIIVLGYVEPVNNRKKSSILRQVIDSDTQLYKFAMRKTVAIVGAGFAGVYLYQLIRKHFDVTLFDEKPNFEYKGDYHLLVGDPSQINKMVKPYKEFIQQAKIVQQPVLSVTPNGVYLDNEKHVEETLLPFDYTVVCTGSSAWVPFSIDAESEPCCLYPYQSKTILDKFTKLLEAKTICVIGGGTVGLEVVGELCSTYKNAQIVLISQRSTFLERMCPMAHNVVVKTLAKYPNLKQFTSRRVIEIKNRTLYFKLVTDRDEDTQNIQAAIEQLKADVFVVCVGTSPRTQVFQKHFPHALSKRGFVRVNNQFQVACTAADQKANYHRNIFAIGDICDIDEEKLAQTARIHAQVLAKNLRLIDRSEDEKKLITHVPEPRLQLISLGKSSAIMIIGDKVITDGNLTVKLKNLTRTKVMYDIKG